MRTGKLNARKVATVKPGKYGDGGGLWLYVGPNSRSWVYRYMIRGNAREMGLGSVDLLSLAEAREAALLLRKRVHQKPKHGGPIDPLQERQEAQIAQTIKDLTFRQTAVDYLAANRDSWKNAKHRQQWENTPTLSISPGRTAPTSSGSEQRDPAPLRVLRWAATLYGRVFCIRSVTTITIAKTKSSEFGFGGDRPAAAPIASGFFRISTLSGRAFRIKVQAGN